METRTTESLTQRIKANDRRLAKALSAIDPAKMAAMKQLSRKSRENLQKNCRLQPEEAMDQAKKRRKRKVELVNFFQIDRTPELDNEELLRRKILTKHDSSSDESEQDAGETSKDRKDLNLCLQGHEKPEPGVKGKDPWWLHREDCSQPLSRNIRYFEGGEKHWCDLCDMRGHYEDSCPLGAPICVLCGKLGHRKDACKSVVCHACLKTGHKAVSCALAASRRDSRCSRCGGMGHVMEVSCFVLLCACHFSLTRPNFKFLVFSFARDEI